MEALIFDSHAHYDDEQFDPDREALLGKALPEAGVCGILNMGADLQGCYDTAALTEQYSYVYGAVGIHPECAKELPENWLTVLRELLKKEKIVAVGEIGLDYHWLDSCPKERQQEVFSTQLELSRELSLPVAVHDREAHADTLEFLRRYRPQGVVHCFSGSVEMAREVVKLGMYELPLDRLLLETDAPYMAPEPYRGKRNDSSLILHVAKRIGELRGEAPEVILQAAGENTRRLFRLPA